MNSKLWRCRLFSTPADVLFYFLSDEKVQCSVCWEDFTLGESVRRLDCDHLFHSPCIVPWLELHGTCPVCRKDLGGDTGQAEGGADAEASNPEGAAAAASTTGGGTGGSSGANAAIEAASQMASSLFSSMFG